mmetsp:Transcript_31830/g.52460  ORF Transcript_31830/g.52460 Transcript_31830/m.52460 type:complete len:145 (+) Transcript_31830:63-497(+)
MASSSTADPKQGAGILIRTLQHPPNASDANADQTNARNMKPQKGDTCLVQYQGFLETNLDTPFCDSGNQPLAVVIGQPTVMEGWQLALPCLSKHQKVQVTIPHLYAYGEEGYPPTIPSKATLIFTMEIIQILPHRTTKRRRHNN